VENYLVNKKRKLYRRRKLSRKYGNDNVTAHTIFFALTLDIYGEDIEWYLELARYDYLYVLCSGGVIM